MKLDPAVCYRAVLALDPNERDEIAQALWHSIAPSNLTHEQIAELKRRIEAIDRGETEFIPGKQAIHELRQRFEH